MCAWLGGFGFLHVVWVEGQHRHRHLRPELGDQLLWLKRKFLEGAPLQVLDAHPRLFGRDLALVR